MSAGADEWWWAAAGWVQYVSFVFSAVERGQQTAEAFWRRVATWLEVLLVKAANVVASE